jgi:hypothetical protein
VHKSSGIFRVDGNILIDEIWATHLLKDYETEDPHEQIHAYSSGADEASTK